MNKVSTNFGLKATSEFRMSPKILSGDIYILSKTYMSTGSCRYTKENSLTKYFFLMLTVFRKSEKLLLGDIYKN